MTGTAIYSDLFVFHSSDPTLTSASVKLNLNAIGTMAVGGPFASASVDLQANISTSLAGEIKSNINTTGPATCSSTFGGGAGCTGVIFSGGSLTTQSVVVGLNTPVLVQLRLDAVVTASAPGSSSSSQVQQQFGFPAWLSPLPSGSWHHSRRAGQLRDHNIFAPPNGVPLPAALPLFASGLGTLGLFGWWRKRKAAALSA